MKNILITGGCGFIGVNLIDFIKKNTDFGIIALDNLTLGKKEYLSGYELEMIEGDIRDEKLATDLMKRVSAVIHLAADTRVMDSIDNPDFNFDVNVKGTYTLLRAAKTAGVKNFIFASTGGAIIGEAIPPVNESMVPRPISPYGASKLCGEAYCSAFAGSYDMKTVSLRFSNVYGPHSYHKGSVVATFFKQILRGEQLAIYGDGSQTRDFVFAEDLCNAIVKALDVEKGGKVFQLGAGVETSVLELVALMKSCVGTDKQVRIKHEPARKGEILRNYSDISLAEKSLGYFPKINLQEGLTKTWKWFLDNKERLSK